MSWRESKASQRASLMSWIASKVRNGRYYDGRVRCHSGDEEYGEMFIGRLEEEFNCEGGKQLKK